MYFFGLSLFFLSFSLLGQVPLSNNLIENGSFEDGAPSIQAPPGWALFSNIPGWTKSSDESFELQFARAGGSFPSQGQYKVELDGVHNAGLYQNVEVTPVLSELNRHSQWHSLSQKTVSIPT